jgi:hypothetical protein
VRWRSIHEALTSRGCVYHKSGRRIAQLADREFSPDPSWHVATDMKGLQSELRLQECVPTVADEVKNGFTQLNSSIPENCLTHNLFVVSLCHSWVKAGHQVTIPDTVATSSTPISSSGSPSPTYPTRG